jgi:hypothetical protein
MLSHFYFLLTSSLTPTKYKLICRKINKKGTQLCRNTKLLPCIVPMYKLQHSATVCSLQFLRSRQTLLNPDTRLKSTNISTIHDRYFPLYSVQFYSFSDTVLSNKTYHWCSVQCSLLFLKLFLFSNMALYGILFNAYRHICIMEVFGELQIVAVVLHRGSPVLIYRCSGFHWCYVKGTLRCRLTLHSSRRDVKECKCKI